MRAPAAFFRCAVAVAVAACAPQTRSVTAQAGDYHAYRATRVLPSVASRLTAASIYLERYPDGVFRDEVSEWFTRVEVLFYKSLPNSAEGMQIYVDALPRGPHAPHAEQRRDAFLEAARRLAALGAAFERRLAAAAQSREDVLTAYASWLSRLVEFDGWGRPLVRAGEDPARSRVSDDFETMWQKGSSPRCQADRCTKLLEIPYELEVGGKPAPFECMIEVSLVLSAGKVVGAVVAGPDLFARLTEAHRAVPISRDLESLQATVAFATTFTSGAVERVMPQTRCAGDAKPPAVLVRDCGGLRLEVFPKATQDDDDRVVIHGPPGL